MSFNYKLYDNVLDNDLILRLHQYCNDKPLREGRVALGLVVITRH